MPTDYINMICVGGPAAGKLIQVGQGQNAVNIISDSETEIELKFDSASISSATVGYETYTVRTCAFPRSLFGLTEKIQYLALSEWTDKQAVVHLLEYYRAK